MKLLINLSEEELNWLKLLLENNSIDISLIRDVVEKIVHGTIVKDVYVVESIHYNGWGQDRREVIETFETKDEAEKFVNENYKEEYNAEWPGIRIYRQPYE